MTTVLAIGVILLAMAVIVVRRRSAAGRATPRKQPNKFAAAELQPGLESCEAARQLAGKRLLATDAPMLPLDGCTERCRCAYKRYTDRRQEARRTADYGFEPTITFVGQERRRNPDRRKREAVGHV